MNQNPEQLARDTIDFALQRSRWLIQDKSKIKLAAGLSIETKITRNGSTIQWLRTLINRYSVSSATITSHV